MVNEKEGKGLVKEVPCFGLRLRGVYPVLSDFTVCKSTLMCYYQSRRQTAFGKNSIAEADRVWKKCERGALTRWEISPFAVVSLPIAVLLRDGFSMFLP